MSIKKINNKKYNSEHQQKQQANIVTNKRLWCIMNAQEWYQNCSTKIFSSGPDFTLSCKDWFTCETKNLDYIIEFKRDNCKK